MIHFVARSGGRKLASSVALLVGVAGAGACGRVPGSSRRQARMGVRGVAVRIVLGVVLGVASGLASRAARAEVPDAPSTSATTEARGAVQAPGSDAPPTSSTPPATQGEPASTAPAAGKPPSPPERITRHTRMLFGTPIEIMASAAGTDDEMAAAIAAAFEEMRRVEVLVDEDNPRSAVFRINADAGKDPVVVEPELFFVLSEVVRLGKATKGAFDVTAAVFNAAWRFEGAGEGSPGAPPNKSPLPTRSEIDKARSVAGPEALILDAAGRTARLVQPGARIALRTIVRGYALDRAAAVLEEQGLQDFVLSGGGDLVVRGKKGGRPWTVGVQDPRAAGYFAALPAPRGALMTTGDYEEFFFDGGARYHNVIDPRSGLPATQCRAVTVLGQDALSAEALSRAVFVLGAKEGLVLAERLRFEAIIVTGDNKVVMTKGLRDVVQVRPPTDGP